MKLTITFLHLDHTPTLDKRIKEKSHKIDKYFQGRSHIKWTCFVKNGEHYAEVIVHVPGATYHATAKSEKLYKSFDKVVEKVEKQLSKKKQKSRNKIHRRTPQRVILEPAEAWGDYEEAA